MKCHLAILLVFCVLGCDAQALEPGQVQSAQGVIEAATIKIEGVVAYHGIPYAAPPVGEGRWRAPASPEPWEGVRSGAEFGNRCIQTNPWPDMIWNSPEESEDCLYLSVWAPEDAEGLPVMFWIHGGGYSAGSGGEERHNGSLLPTKGVVLVTINYRLGVLGFLSHPELTAESGHGASGNYGLMDMVAALEWTQDNIAAFGGNPDNVTIFGESAGSAAVSALMASPLSEGLFHRAIGQSGGHFSMFALSMSPRAEAEERGVRFVEAAGAASLDEMRASPPAKLIEAAASAGGFSVIQDGYVLPRPPQEVFEAGEQHDVPLMAGWTSAEAKWWQPTLAEFEAGLKERFPDDWEEAAVHYQAASDEEAALAGVTMASDGFVVFPTWKWIELQAETGTQPVYRYVFDQVLATADGPVAEDDPGAAHATDIPFVFGTMDYMGNPVGDEDRFVSDLMMDYWTAFAASGNPNLDARPDWPAWTSEGDRMLMRLHAEAASEQESDRARFEFLDGRDG